MVERGIVFYSKNASPARVERTIYGHIQGRFRLLDENTKIPGAVRSKKLAQITEAFKKALELDGKTAPVDRTYGQCLELIRHMRFKSAEIEEFSKSLKNFENEPNFASNAGIFLSALVNSRNDRVFTIHTTGLSVLIDYLGYSNTKNLTINGNAGRGLGAYMASCDGSIVVEGTIASLGIGIAGGEIYQHSSALVIDGFRESEPKSG